MANVGLTFYNKDFVNFSDISETIAESAKRILLTRPGERVNDLSFGSRLQEYIFNSSSMAIEDILTEIKNSLERNDYRIIVKNVSLEKIEGDIITINLFIVERNTGSNITVGVTL